MLTSRAIAPILVTALVLYPAVVSSRPASFLEDFHVTWADSHIRQLEGGPVIQLVLDRNSGWSAV
ncbi:hypothetical protein SAY86_024313 [Trapa natans]|uniref:Uncharacterized protein n=1 Tax=Trapa natans TaxID=22666 RepID=A0AAN7RJI9_TRANT|nr:hypothetical protein SAY86_024313 [Trapa natans]